MAKAKTPLIDKNLEKFVINNFDKKDREKQGYLKFEWFANSMHIWQSSSQAYNSNTKIGKEVSLGNSQGGDAFYMSINNFERIFSLNDNIEDILDYLKKNGKIITFHFIQSKKSNSVSWEQFLNLIDLPLKIWRGHDFDSNQPILKKLQTFIDSVTDEDDPILGKIDHKIEIVFYTNKDNENILFLEKSWNTNINNKRSELGVYFSAKNIDISLRGSEFLNEVYEKMNSNEYSLLINKDEVIEAEEKKYLIGYITAKELLDSIAPKVNGNRVLYPDVFKNNIRLYLGQNEINKDIERTLIEEPNKFHFYNNGLTITTKEISDNSKNFIISPVNIVNGCQTANSLYNASKEIQFKEDEIKIPLKVIVAKDLEYESITIRSNTQNGIESKDLISITNIQKELQEKFQNANFLGKVFYYKRQKSGEEIESTNADFIIQIDDILRATFSTLMFIPNKVLGYFDQTTLKYVNKIFDERFTDLYLLNTVLLKMIEEEVDEQHIEFKRLKYHLLFVVYKLINKGLEIKSIEDYFRDSKDDTLDDQSIQEQNALIAEVSKRLRLVLQNRESFINILQYVIKNIKRNYPELLDLSDKEKERILYRPVEKLKRSRTTPIFGEFYEVFNCEFQSLISENNINYHNPINI